MDRITLYSRLGLSLPLDALREMFESEFFKHPNPAESDNSKLVESDK
jgi:hypothetical protein